MSNYVRLEYAWSCCSYLTCNFPLTKNSGLTETSPIIAINAPYPGMRKSGSVGKAVGGVEVVIMNPETNLESKLGEDGQICCHGRNVMRGYYGKPDDTAEVITVTPDGRRL